MANIKSAKKRILVTETKAARNKAIKSGVKTAIKKVEAAVAANDKAAAEAALKDATSAIASAGSKGIFHKNNVARKVSRLTKLVHGLASYFIAININPIGAVIPMGFILFHSVSLSVISAEYFTIKSSTAI